MIFPGNAFNEGSLNKNYKRREFSTSLERVIFLEGMFARMSLKPIISGTVKMFSQSLLLLLLLYRMGTVSGAQPLGVAAEITLTNAAQIRSLKATIAGWHLPVQLRGVVIGEVEPGGDMVLQDSTAGIALIGSTNYVGQLFPGDEIEITGTTETGRFVPSVVVKSLRKLGSKALPEPKRVTFEELLTGRFEAQWIEIKGIVRACEPAGNGARGWRVALATGGGRLTMRSDELELSQSLVDAEVRVRGVCRYLANQNRSKSNPMATLPHDPPMVTVPRGVPIQILTGVPADPFGAPLRPLDSLVNSAQEGSYGHRIHVHGVVTRHQPGEFIFIRDEGLGLRVQTAQVGELNLGDEVEILGFTKQGNYSLMLEDAVFRKISSGVPPQPVPLTNAASPGELDANLVAVEGAFMQRRYSSWAEFFDFHTDRGINFTALLRTREGVTNVLNLPESGRFKVVGICVMDRIFDQSAGGISQPESFQILLRSKADLILLSRPPWWTRQQNIRFLGSLAVLSLITVAAVVFLARQRLKEQEARRLAAENEFALIFAERNRMAREIHDTLAQGLGGISIHLEFIKNRLPEVRPEISKHLEIARDLVRHSLADARNAIWDMRSQALQEGDLVSALDTTMKQLTEGSNVSVRLNITGSPRRISPAMENDLLHIGQEALCNAVKHARATKIELNLDFGKDEIRLSVMDDGCGFAPDKSPPRTDSFGIIGMKERVQQLRGQLLVQSRLGAGTQILATVPNSGT